MSVDADLESVTLSKCDDRKCTIAFHSNDIQGLRIVCHKHLNDHRCRLLHLPGPGRGSLRGRDIFKVGQPIFKVGQPIFTVPYAQCDCCEQDHYVEELHIHHFPVCGQRHKPRGGLLSCVDMPELMEKLGSRSGNARVFCAIVLCNTSVYYNLFSADVVQYQNAR